MHTLLEFSFGGKVSKKLPYKYATGVLQPFKSITVRSSSDHHNLNQ